VPAIRTSKAANFDGAYAPSGSLPLYFFIALLLLLCFLADVVRVPSVGTHIGELVSSDTQNSYGVPSVISKAYWLGTCESEISVRIESRIESEGSRLHVQCRLPHELCRPTASNDIARWCYGSVQMEL